MAAGEITAPSLLARDVHKLCITLSGAQVNKLCETRTTRIARSYGSIERSRNTLSRITLLVSLNSFSLSLVFFFVFFFEIVAYKYLKF